MVDKTREIALKVLYKIEEEKAYSNIILNKYISDNKSKKKKKDIGLLSEIVYGVTTWKLTLDYIIQKYSKIDEEDYIIVNDFITLEQVDEKFRLNAMHFSSIRNYILCAKYDLFEMPHDGYDFY